MIKKNEIIIKVIPEIRMLDEKRFLIKDCVFSPPANN